MIYFLYGHIVKNSLNYFSLNYFSETLTSFIPNLKFTYETPQYGVNFLDLNLSLKNGAIFTDLHVKPTDGHYKSSHLSQTKNSVPYSHALRIITK